MGGGRVNVFLEDILRERALESDEALVLKDLVGDFFAAFRVKFGEVLLNVGDIFVFAGGIGDDVERVSVFKGDDEVVDDPTSDRVEEDGEG